MLEKRFLLPVLIGITAVIVVIYTASLSAPSECESNGVLAYAYRSGDGIARYERGGGTFMVTVDAMNLVRIKREDIATKTILDLTARQLQDRLNELLADDDTAFVSHSGEPGYFIMEYSVFEGDLAMQVRLFRFLDCAEATLNDAGGIVDY